MPLAVVAILFIAALGCWVLATDGPWWKRVAAIAVTPLACLAIWQAVDSARGWSTTDPVPNGALLVGGTVHEPDPLTGTAGAIYLWLEPVRFVVGAHGLGYRPQPGEPRAYRLPYSRSLEVRLLRALRDSQRYPVAVTTRKAVRRHPNHSQNVSRNLIRFRRFPPPQLPPKEGEPK